ELAERAEQEFEALTKELSRAVGLGGRNRRGAAGSGQAPARNTKTSKAVVRRIAEANSRLGDMLSRCIKTGTFCSYQPDPEFPIGWEFAATNLEPEDGRAEPPTSAEQRSSNGHSNPTENY